MLIPAQAALLRHAQDLPAGLAAPRGEARLESGRPPAAGGAVERRREAVLPPLAEGQYEPQPATITFSQFLSGLNPLQHLPVVGMVYRAITGDVPPTVMRVAGGFLLGGPVGGIITAVSAAAEEIFNRSIAGTDPDAPAAQPAQATAVAAAVPPAATPAGVPAAPGSGAPAAEPAIAAPASIRHVAPAGDAGERLARLRAAGDLYTRHMTPVALPHASPGLRPPENRVAGG